MESLIKKIKVDEDHVKHGLEWISKGTGYGLESHDLTHIVRYLLKENSELKEKVQKLIYKVKYK